MKKKKIKVIQREKERDIDRYIEGGKERERDLFTPL